MGEEKQIILFIFKSDLMIDDDNYSKNNNKLNVEHMCRTRQGKVKGSLISLRNHKKINNASTTTKSN